MRIRVDTDHLRLLAKQLNSISTELYGLNSNIGHAIGQLDWQVPQAAGIEGDVSYARNLANSLASEASDLVRSLINKAIAFEQADNEGVASLQQLSGEFAALQSKWAQSGLPRRAPYPAEAVEAQMRLGQILGASTVVGSAQFSVPTPVPVPTPEQVGTSGATVNVDNLIETGDKAWGAKEVIESLLGIPAALALGYTLRNGKVIITGSQTAKELAGLSEHLTWIRPENLPLHMAQQGIKGSIVGIAVDVGLQWLKDFRTYGDQGQDKLGGALLVDGILKTAIGLTVGAGVGLIGAGLVAASAPAVAVVAGGVAGGLLLGMAGTAAFNWLDQSGIRGKMIDTASSGISGAGSALRGAGGAVGSFTGQAVSAAGNFTGRAMTAAGGLATQGATAARNTVSGAVRNAENAFGWAIRAIRDVPWPQSRANQPSEAG